MSLKAGSEATSEDAGRFQILALDGGGIRGIFSAAVLAALEDDLGIRVVDRFDLISGTSTGGIIALGLGLGIRPREILEFYLEHGRVIFSRQWGGSLFHWVARKHSAGRLEVALKKVFAERTLGECCTRLVIPAYNLGEDDVYTFRTAHDERLRRDFKVPAWKIALATAAAPTYFSGCRQVDSARLIDGGVWANNPAMVALSEAAGTLRIPLGAIRLFSLGTTDPVVARPPRLDWGGKIIWAAGNHVMDVILRGQSLAAQNQTRLLLGDDSVLRVNPVVARDEYSLDGVQKAEDLVGKAGHVSRKCAPDFMRLFAAHKAAPFTPCWH